MNIQAHCVPLSKDVPLLQAGAKGERTYVFHYIY
jgi:hypothetical protein